MRQPQQNQQHNRRGRGRGRKPQNPLQRGYESNGPDVKLRGNASHIAEKYITLARDALSSGDTVMAENYLQHAEHYNRIIATAQQQQETSNNGSQSHSASQQNNSSNGQGNTQSGSRGDAPQRGRRNQKNNDATPAESTGGQDADQPVKAAEKSEVPTEDVAATEEPAPKPRRRRAPRTKAAAAAPAAGDEGSSGPGPVRMGDVPMDEVSN